MKVLTRTIILIISSFAFFSKANDSSCDILNKVKLTKISHFSPEVKFGFETEQSMLLNKKEYRKLFGEEMIETDSVYLFGKFNINRNRIGVYSYRTTYECDHRIGMVELQIFESCKKIGSHVILFEDNDGLIYNISSEFSDDFENLTIIERKNSEYAYEPEVDADTLFTNTYRIDLKSNKLDTISKKSKFEILKSPPQN